MKKVFVAWIGLLFCMSTWAMTSPVDLLVNTSNQLLTTLQQNQATLRTKPQLVYGIVNQILLPHVDLYVMASRALGRNAWIQASPAQREAFTRQFTTLLIRTYSSALARYTNERVSFLPLRGGYMGQSRVQVDSNIIRDNGPAIHVSYRLMNEGGQWKLYDFSVDGISLIQSFRSQFAEELNQGGIEGLINRLAQHNAQF